MKTHNETLKSLIIPQPNPERVEQHANEDKAYDRLDSRRWLQKRKDKKSMILGTHY